MIPEPHSACTTANPTKDGPASILFDLLGRRWMLRILFELHEEMLTFRALQLRCGSPSESVLNARIRELDANGLVDISDGEGYLLTELGGELASFLVPLARWSTGWSTRWTSYMKRCAIEPLPYCRNAAF
jgi:DNA-binding HxlR family transcriptional regulator